jgi:ABC-2 type transport system permease protein
VNWRRIRRIIIKEFLQLRRDRRVLGIVLAAPVFQLFVFAYAVTTDVRHIATAIYDEDRTAVSRDFISRFAASGYFEIGAYLDRPQQADRLLDTGRAQIVIHLPRGFAEDLARGRTAPVQVLLDGSDSMTAGIIAGYVGGVVRAYSGDVLVQRLDRLRGRLTRVPSLDPRVRVWYNPELKSVNYMVPGVLCLILLLVTMILTSMAIVKEREIGTLEMLVVTPIRPRELMIGKTVPFVLIGFVDMLLVLAVSVFWFRVAVEGSVLLLFACAALFILTSLGVGLFISTVSRTQQQAMMTGFFFMFPSIILSGFMFPIANMPPAIQWLTYGIPLRYFLEIVRGVFLKGNGVALLWPQMLALTVLGLVILSLSALRFRKRLG